MKPDACPINIPADIAAKCDGPDQFKKFDQLFRAVIATPKKDIDKREKQWKRKQEQERTKRS